MIIFNPGFFSDNYEQQTTNDKLPNMKSKVQFAILLFIAGNCFAQSKMLSMEDAVLGQKIYLAPQKLEQLDWIPGTDNYYFIGGKEKDSLMIGNAVNGKSQEKLLLKQFNIALQTAGLDTVKEFPILTWMKKDAFDFSI